MDQCDKISLLARRDFPFLLHSPKSDTSITKFLIDGIRPHRKSVEKKDLEKRNLKTLLITFFIILQ